MRSQPLQSQQALTTFSGAFKLSRQADAPGRCADDRVSAGYGVISIRGMAVRLQPCHPQSPDPLRPSTALVLLVAEPRSAGKDGRLVLLVLLVAHIYSMDHQLVM